MKSCWDMIMDILRLIIPVITFVLGYFLSNRSIGKRNEYESIKELFIKFYVPFITPFSQLFEKENDKYFFYDEDTKQKINKLLCDYEFMLPLGIQKQIYSFRMTCIVFADDEERVNGAWENLRDEVFSEYKNVAKKLNYEINDRF